MRVENLYAATGFVTRAFSYRWWTVARQNVAATDA